MKFTINFLAKFDESEMIILFADLLKDPAELTRIGAEINSQKSDTAKKGMANPYKDAFKKLFGKDIRSLPPQAAMLSRLNGLISEMDTVLADSSASADAKTGANQLKALLVNVQEAANNTDFYGALEKAA